MLKFSEEQIKNHKTLFTFKVYWSGWECDSRGHVKITEGGDKYLALTSHGGFYVASCGELHDFISEYEKAISDMQKAISLLEGK